jgi:protein MpaA
LPGQSNSSSFGPSKGGPSLGLPEARHENTGPSAPHIAKLQAPDPKAHTSRYHPETAAEAVSSAERPSILDEPTWSRFYRSTDRRPVETLILGSGPSRVAILASLHGDETQSVSLVENLARSLRAHPEQLRNATVLLVKSPNPDGFYGRTAYNINGVDLNRNFPSDNWKELRNNRAGAAAASEAETRVVVRVLGDFRPALVVHVKDSRQSGVVNYEGEIQPLADQIASMLSGQTVHGLGEKTSGSVESYVMTRLASSSLTLLLVREDSDEAAWAKNRDALLAILGQSATAPGAEEKSSSFNDQPDPFEEPMIHKSSMRRQRTSAPDGNGTAAAPARSKKHEPLPEFPAPVPDHGYLELPPP